MEEVVRKRGGGVVSRGEDRGEEVEKINLLITWSSFSRIESANAVISFCFVLRKAD